MKIYTRTGDTGETSLYGGTRISKDALRVRCYGSVDEANCALGVAAAHLDEDESVKEIVRHIQRKMFVVGAELASDEAGAEQLKERIAAEDIEYLEKLIDDLTEKQDRQKGFAMPGETVPSAFLHVARTMVRKTERHVVALAKEECVSNLVLQYLNRLSDALYVLAEG